MDKQTPSTSLRHNDALSEALISSYTRWMDGDTFQHSTVEEEGIPALKKREDLDNGTKKDPKANAGAPDPATALVGSMTMGQGSASGGVKQSHGAEIRDTTKLVARRKQKMSKKERKDSTPTSMLRESVENRLQSFRVQRLSSKGCV